MRLRARWLLAFTAAFFLATPATAEKVVVTADRMVDVLAGRVVDNPAVFIGDDGRITSVGDARTVRWGNDVRHIALPGRTLLPGFIDMHVHLSNPAEIRGLRRLELADGVQGMIGVANARAMLEAGFTTVRNVGGGREDVALKQTIDLGYAQGPRIVPAGFSLGATGGHCDNTLLPARLERDRPAEGIADSVDGLRYQVRRQRKYGAEVIKVCATGGVFSRNTEPGQQQLSEAELRAIADEAHQWGLRVAAHAHGADGIKAAIRAGIDTIEHASLADEEGIRLAVQRKRPVWFSMDIYNTEYTQSQGLKTGVSADNLRKDREVAQIQRDNFRRAHRAGVRMVFGSDAGVMPHGTAAGQFKTMVDYGMTPLEAIRAATRNAAEALGRERDVGAIAVGRFGDLVAVSGDPLRDPAVLARVEAVVKGGTLVKPLEVATPPSAAR